MWGSTWGFRLPPSTLRAPHISVGQIADEPGWGKGVPRLAVEYADTDKDEDNLATKIVDLLSAGTEHFWVVRIHGRRRVEVHRPGTRMRIVNLGEKIEAPGILQNAVPVQALYDAGSAGDVALRNLLQRRGYSSLEAALHKWRTEASAEGALLASRESLLAVLEAREVELDDEQHTAVATCADITILRRWLVDAATASAADNVFL